MWSLVTLATILAAAMDALNISDAAARDKMQADVAEFLRLRVKNVLDEAGIPVLTIEVDRQMVNFEQIRTAAEAFKDAVG